MAAPKLRFKEFDKAFSRNTIKELAKIYVGRDLVEDAYSPIKTETHIYPIYSNSVDNEGLYGYYNFEEFNFDDDALTVVGRGAGLGKAFYRQGGFGTIGRLCIIPADKKLTIAQNILGLRFEKDEVNPLFMYYQMDSCKFRNDVNARLVITVQASIKRKDLDTISILIPPSSIQQTFCSFIDKCTNAI